MFLFLSCEDLKVCVDIGELVIVLCIYIYFLIDSNKLKTAIPLLLKKKTDLLNKKRNLFRVDFNFETDP